jgi:hypothetical protein
MISPLLHVTLIPNWPTLYICINKDEKITLIALFIFYKNYTQNNINFTICLIFVSCFANLYFHP